MKPLFLKALAIVFSLSAASAAFAQLDVGDYALIVKGNATLGGGHVDYGAIVGGKLKTTGDLQFGSSFSSNSTPALIVGGGVSAGSNQIALFNQAYYLSGGSAGLHLQNPGTALSTNPLSPGTINTMFNQFSAMSTGLLSQVGAVPAYSISGNKLTITAVAGQLNVITFTRAQLSAFFSGSNLEIDYKGITSPNTKLVINYVGNGGPLAFNAKTLGLTTSTDDQVLWNFTGVSTLTFGSAADSFSGTIFAPNANVVWNANNLYGQLIASSYVAAECREIHDYAFVTELPPIPEPSTYGLMGVGALAGLTGYRRWRNRRAAKVA